MRSHPARHACGAWGLAAALAALTACSSGSEGEDALGFGDPQRDGGGGGLECPRGQHECDGACVADAANFPENGCRLGCGAACPGPVSGHGAAACGDDGLCSATCAEGYELFAGDCVCAQGLTCEALGRACGTVDDGCGGTLDCGNCQDGESCVDGQCGGCDLDAAEPNDKDRDAHALGAFTDSPKTGEVWTDFGLDRETDTDWFTAEVKDKFGITNPGNPDVRVTLSGLPAGDDYELAAWYVCASGGGGGSCDEGAEDEGAGGCLASTSGGGSATVKISSSCNGTNESGTVVIRVSAASWAGSCGNYTLELKVD